MKMQRGALLVSALAGLSVAATVIAIPIGRHERSKADAVQVARIRAVQAAIGPTLDPPTLKAYRVDPGFLCLLYARGERYFAYELCYDQQGRLVEAVDRSGSAAIYGSVVYDPALAPSRISIAAAVQLLRRHRVPAKVIASGGF